MYNTDSWRTAELLSTSTWMDLSGTGNHVTEVGGTTSIAVARPVGAPAYIYGASTAWLKFPVGILPSAEYTLFYVARYNGFVKDRIFNGVNTNWLSGFIISASGIPVAGGAQHGDPNCGWITQNGYLNPLDLHGTDWVLGSDRSNSFRSNGKSRTVAGASGCAVFDRLAVNTGFANGRWSDFAIQSVLVYKVKLSDADVQRVEAWLQAQQPAFTPANLQVGAGLNCISFVLFSLYI